jgi:small subunit ribosomal protein S11e
VRSRKPTRGKGGARFWKSPGLGFKVPREAIEGKYIDNKCPFTSDISIRGRILSGIVKKHRMQRTLVVRRDYLHFLPKYQRCALFLSGQLSSFPLPCALST